jgi:hypothetical protein
MAIFRVIIGGQLMSLIDTADSFSKDPGPNTSPQAGPNTPVNTGGAKTVQLNYSETSGSSGQVLASIQNPG